MGLGHIYTKQQNCCLVGASAFTKVALPSGNRHQSSGIIINKINNIIINIKINNSKKSRAGGKAGEACRVATVYMAVGHIYTYERGYLLLTR